MHRNWLTTKRTNRDDSRQVMSSQGVRTKDTNVKGSKLISRSAYRNALIRGGVVSDEEKKSCTLQILGHVDYPKIGEIIEKKLIF